MNPSVETVKPLTSHPSHSFDGNKFILVLNNLFLDPPEEDKNTVLLVSWESWGSWGGDERDWGGEQAAAAGGFPEQWGLSSRGGFSELTQGRVRGDGSLLGQLLPSWGSCFWSLNSTSPGAEREAPGVTACQLVSLILEATWNKLGETLMARVRTIPHSFDFPLLATWASNLGSKHLVPANPRNQHKSMKALI